MLNRSHDNIINHIYTLRISKYTFYKQRQEALLFMTNTNITADNVDSIVSVEVINILEKNSQYPYGWYVWPNMLLSYYEPNCSNP
jgi:hypothetical protein